MVNSRSQEQPDGGEPEGPNGFFRVFDTYATYAPTSNLGLGLDVNYVTNEVHTSDRAGGLVWWFGNKQGAW